MDVRELPFDQYQRYRLVSDLLAALRPDPAARLQVLDVGGRTALLRQFLSQDDVTLVDVEPSAEPGLVLGSGAALPFADNSFDVVCAFDTLEHVPPELRTPFLSECHRVARRWVLIAGPYATERVNEAEELLARFMREKLRFHHRYLEEHRTNGLPDRAAVSAHFERLGARTTSVGHANLERWLALMTIAMYMDDDPALRGILKDVNRFYNEALYASDHVEPVYRHVVVAALGDALLPTPELIQGRVLEPVDAGPQSGRAIAELGFELMAFDGERDAWRAERDKYRETIADLEADLEAHHKTVKAKAEQFSKLRLEAEAQAAELKAELGEHERVHAALLKHSQALDSSLSEVGNDRDQGRLALEEASRDLSEHRLVVAELQGTAEGVGKQLKAVIADRAAVMADREAVIAARDALVADRDALAADRDALAADRDALAADRDALAADRDAHAVHSAELEAELQRLRAEAQTLNADLVRSNEQVAELRDEFDQTRQMLSDRIGNLKRAISPNRSD